MVCHLHLKGLKSAQNLGRLLNNRCVSEPSLWVLVNTRGMYKNDRCVVVLSSKSYNEEPGNRKFYPYIRTIVRCSKTYCRRRTTLWIDHKLFLAFREIIFLKLESYEKSNFRYIHCVQKSLNWGWKWVFLFYIRMGTRFWSRSVFQWNDPLQNYWEAPRMIYGFLSWFISFSNQETPLCREVSVAYFQTKIKIISW